MGSEDANDRRLHALAGCFNGFVIEMDSDLRHVNVWADDESLLVCPAKDMIGRTIEEVLGPVAGPRLGKMMRELFATGVSAHFEAMIPVDGQPRWILSDMKRVELNDCFSVVVFGRDITELKLKEQALRESEERYRFVEQATNDVLYDWDIATGRIVWGAAAGTVFFVDEPTPTVDWFWSRIHHDDIERVRATYAAAVGSGEASWSGAYRFRRGDGSYADMLDRLFIVRREGEPHRVVGSMTDVTKMNRLQTQLVQAERLAALGLLAAGVGHELNNPLCYVLGNIEIMLQSGPFATNANERAEEEDARSALREARDGAVRMAEIVKGLKLFSRADADVRAPVAIGEVIESSLKLAENEIKHRARLVRKLAPVPTVLASESQLVQVCLNLLINAAQAIPPGNSSEHEICVEAGTDDAGRAFFAVSDTGTGVEEADLARIFDPFFTTKPVGVGTGIGLSVCMNIVQAMGGRLTVTSIPNERTTFTVSLATA